VPQDVVLHRRWLRELVRVAQADPRVLVAVTNTLAPGSPAYDPQNRDGDVEECTWVDVAPLGYVRLRPGPFDPEPRLTLACAGCSALIRRGLLERTGRLFDGRVGHYAGDVEAGLRAAVAGGLVVQVPTAIVYHVGEEAKAEAPFDPRLLLRYAAGSRDQILVYWKLMGSAEFLVYLPLLLLGLSCKAFELRVPPAARLALFAAALALTPGVALAALARLAMGSAAARQPAAADQLAAARREMAAARRVPPFWLLRAVLCGPPRRRSS
jgi:GT2 family glycosyltransferase